MKDDQKTKRQLIEELNEQRQRVAELEGIEEEIGQIRADHEKFTKAFLQNSIPVAITTLKEGRFIDVSGSFLVFMECKRNEVIGRTSAEIGFITEEQRVSFLHELTKKGRIENIEIKCRTKGGAGRFGLFNAVMMSLGNEKCLLSVMIDITERKQLEDELKRSETKFRTLFNSTGDAVMLLDEKIFLDCNKATLAIFGCATREEFCKRHPAELSPSQQSCGTDSMVLANQMIAGAMEKGSIHFEWMHKRNDTGETFPADVLLTAMELDGKKVVQAVVRDITERKRAEEKSQNTLNFLQTLINTIPSPIFCKDIHGRYQDCNKEFENYTGLRREEIIGKSVYDMYPKDVADKYHERDLALFRKPGRQIYEHPIIYAGGERHDVVVNKATYFNADGTLGGLVGVMVDITERKQVEQELANRLIFQQTLIDTIPHPIFFKTEVGRFVGCNRAYEREFGTTRDYMIGKTVLDLEYLPIDERQRFQDEDMMVIREADRKSYEMPIVYADGQIHMTLYSVDGFTLADGKPGGLIGMLVDISERKRAEDELAKYREGLEQLVLERTHDLENKTKALEELNIALKVLLQHREEDKKDLENRFVMNIKNLILPFAEKMKTTHLDERQLAYLSIIETHLNYIASPMIKKMHQFNFTHTEIEVASLIKEGKATKIIAGMMGIATSSIDTHRNNIRKKLGISKKDVNLRSHLQSLD